MANSSGWSMARGAGRRKDRELFQRKSLISHLTRPNKMAE
jgi:hypothetical protein